MADAYTNAAALDSDTAAYEAVAYFALRPELLFDAVADVKPTSQTHRGSSVTFMIYDDLAAQTTPLSETADPDALAASDTTVVVTPSEYGAVIKTTAKLRATSFLPVDTDVANLIGYNAGLTLDTLARTQLEAGSNVRYATGGADDPTARNQVDADDILTGKDIMRARTDLVKASVRPAKGQAYYGFIHPDVAYDLRSETGGSSWRDPHVYSQPEQIWSGEIGMFEGVAFIETPRGPLFADASNGAGASGTIDVYGTLICGKQALALAHGQNEDFGRFPTIVKGPRVDALQRIQPVGWRSFIGYGRFREASLRRIEGSSSIGENS